VSAFWCSYLTVSVAGFGHFRKRMVSWGVYFGVIMANPVCSMPRLPICAQERTLSGGRTVICHLEESGQFRTLAGDEISGCECPVGFPKESSKKQRSSAYNSECYVGRNFGGTSVRELEAEP
jgi:hypothetical protein